MTPAETKVFKSDAKAWAWFSSSAPSYQRACKWWIRSAKRPETRQRRLEHVMTYARKSEVAPQYQWRKGSVAAGRPAKPTVESL